MAANKAILKNTTNSDIELKVLGIELLANSSKEIEATDYLVLISVDSITELDPLLSSGDIVVNDGVRDITSANEREYLSSRTAFGNRFQNDADRGNGFISTNTQEAIEELLNIAAPLRVPISLIYNGTLSNGNFIGYSNLLPGDATPIIIPITGFFVEFTWSNNLAGADFALEFRKNTTSGTPFFTWSVDNTKNAAVILPTPQTVTQGDSIYVKYIDEGTNAKDAAIVLLFKS